MTPIQLYSLATPNGQKIAIALEELALPYQAHRIDIRKDEQFSEGYLRINPNGKIPTIIDPEGPDGKELILYESGAILLYLAEKSGKLPSTFCAERVETTKWIIWQAANVGPMFGRFGHFYAMRNHVDHDIIQYFADNVHQLLEVLELQLQNNTYVLGEQYSIADIAIFPWIDALEWAYKSHDYLQMKEYEAMYQWYQECLQKPSTIRGKQVTPY
jgi:GST-like protein